MALSRELFENPLYRMTVGGSEKDLLQKSAQVFICDACNAETRLNYGCKLSIFDGYGDSSGPRRNREACRRQEVFALPIGPHRCWRPWLGRLRRRRARRSIPLWPLG